MENDPTEMQKKLGKLNEELKEGILSDEELKRRISELQEMEEEEEKYKGFIIKNINKLFDFENFIIEMNEEEFNQEKKDMNRERKKKRPKGPKVMNEKFKK